MPLGPKFKVGDRVILTNIGGSWGTYFKGAEKNNPLQGSEWACEGIITEIHPNVTITVRWDNGSGACYGPVHLDFTTQFQVGDRVVFLRGGKSWEIIISYPDIFTPLQGNKLGCKGTIREIVDGIYIDVKWDNGVISPCGPAHLGRPLTSEKSIKPITSGNEHPLALLRDVIPYDPYGKRSHSQLMQNNRDRNKKPISKDQFKKGFKTLTDLLEKGGAKESDYQVNQSISFVLPDPVDFIIKEFKK